MTKKWTKKQRQEALKLAERLESEGKSQEYIATRIGIVTSTLRKWKMEAALEAALGSEDASEEFLGPSDIPEESVVLSDTVETARTLDAEQDEVPPSDDPVDAHAPPDTQSEIPRSEMEKIMTETPEQTKSIVKVAMWEALEVEARIESLSEQMRQISESQERMERVLLPLCDPSDQRCIAKQMARATKGIEEIQRQQSEQIRQVSTQLNELDSRVSGHLQSLTQTLKKQPRGILLPTKCRG